MNGRSADRVGTMEFAGMGGQYRYPIGYDAYLMYVAMWAQRFLVRDRPGGRRPGRRGARPARVRHRQRPRRSAAGRSTSSSYLAAPYVVDPFRADDCTVEVDGACAVLVTSLDRARDLRRPAGGDRLRGYRAGPRPGLDIGDHLLWSDYTRNYTSILAEDLFGRAGLTPGDVQFAEIYDCFTSTVLIGLEGLGLASGASPAPSSAGGPHPARRRLPTNTHGGLLSEGYLHGMNTVAEAALQVQGRGGERQAPRHEVCVVTSGAHDGRLGHRPHCRPLRGRSGRAAPGRPR